MKATVQDISPVKKKLLVEIDAEEVDKKLNQAYGDIRKRVKIPGFRPGKAPRKILESYYGSQVRDDVTRELIADTFPKAIGETNAFPLGQPVLEKESLRQGSNFTYTAILEVRPQFEVAGHLGVAVKKEILSVTDEDVQKRLEEIRKANGRLTSIEESRPIREGDYVIIEYKGFENGQPIEGVHSSNFLVNVGRNDFHPKFDEGLIGFSKDDQTEMVIDFEEDFYDTRLAGKRVHFQTKIFDVKELRLPELDDAFARSLGSDFEDLEDLKNEIRKAITSQEEERIDRDVKQRLLEKILEEVHFEIPQVLVETETDFSVRRFKENLQRGGASIEKMGFSDERLRQDFRPAAEKRVRELLVLEQIANQEQIVLSEEDLEQGYTDLAQQMGQDVETVKKYYEARDLVEGFKEQLIREKTLNYLREHAIINEVTKEELTQEMDQKGKEG
ncbi:MAG: trigger factor [Desulfococcus sp. 4484_242]|nr:MAG: trigger factor [Desulfococcus sp. 4484_242]